MENLLTISEHFFSLFVYYLGGGVVERISSEHFEDFAIFRILLEGVFTKLHNLVLLELYISYFYTNQL